jgi:methionyl-tRNA formyltransferase
MKKRVVLLANHLPGLEVCRILAEDPSTDLVAVFLTDENSNLEQEISNILCEKRVPVYCGKEIWSSEEVISIFRELNIDFLVSVYWPWILKPKVVALLKDSLNFHPALLPKNRGWYPHVYNLKDGTDPGVTLHRIDMEADTGAIWASRKVESKPTDTASDLYRRLQAEIVKLFKEVWPSVISGAIEPLEQDHSVASYNAKNEILKFDHINLDIETTPRSFINLLRARTFEGNGYAFYFEGDKKISISIVLTEKD